MTLQAIFLLCVFPGVSRTRINIYIYCISCVRLFFLKLASGDIISIYSSQFLNNSLNMKKTSELKSWQLLQIITACRKKYEQQAFFMSPPKHVHNGKNECKTLNCCDLTLKDYAALSPHMKIFKKKFFYRNTFF